MKLNLYFWVVRKFFGLTSYVLRAERVLPSRFVRNRNFQKSIFDNLNKNVALLQMAIPFAFGKREFSKIPHLFSKNRDFQESIFAKEQIA